MTSRPWLIAWLGGPVIGIANGVTRELVYKDTVGDLAAHQISTAGAIGLFGAYFWALQRRYPLASDAAALRVGAFWLTLTILFEFGFGRAVDGRTWAELLADYDLSEGRVWSLVLAWLALGPLVIRRASRRLSTGGRRRGAPPAGPRRARARRRPRASRPAAR